MLSKRTLTTIELFLKLVRNKIKVPEELYLELMVLLMKVKQSNGEDKV